MQPSCGFIDAAVQIEVADKRIQPLRLIAIVHVFDRVLTIEYPGIFVILAYFFEAYPGEFIFYVSIITELTPIRND